MRRCLRSRTYFQFFNLYSNSGVRQRLIAHLAIAPTWPQDFIGVKRRHASKAAILIMFEIAASVVS